MFASNPFDLLELHQANLETPYGSFFERPTGIQGTAHFEEPVFGSSINLDFIDCMNQDESRVISTSTDTREIIDVGTLDLSRLDPPRLADKITYPSLNSTGIGRQQPYPLPSSSARLGATSTSPSTGCIRPHAHRSSPSRNQVATAKQVDVIMRLLGQSNFSEGAECPVAGCTHQQLNGRIQDFHRHLKTHLKNGSENRCKGVPWAKFLSDPLFSKISEGKQPYTVPDEDGLWIGGCLKTFSRSDALKRHLGKTSCVAVNSRKTITLAPT